MIGKYIRTASLFIFLIFCLTGTAEANSYSGNLYQSGMIGADRSNGNSGATSQHSRGSSCSGEVNKRQRVPKPKLYRKGVGNRKSKGYPCRKKKKSRRKRIKSSAAKKENEKEVKESQAKAVERSEQKKVKTRIERVDDIPFLLGVMIQMGLYRIIDQYIPKHHKQRDLSWGYTAIIWLAYILSEGDHRKVSMREYVKRMSSTLLTITGQEIDELDFTDDRLGVLLKYLSKKSYWEKIERELSERSIEAYQLPTETVRCDATTVSGYHKIREGGLFQKGVSKDDPKRPQIKLMTGALDPLGMPLATDVVSGERADDVLYRPVIKRINAYLKDKAVLYVGDSKLSAFETRTYIKDIGKHYLCPMPNTGDTAKNMEGWVLKGIMPDSSNALCQVYAEKDGKERLIAKGYEFSRRQCGKGEKGEVKWTERVLIVNSPSYAKSQARGLEKRLENATEKLLALTPQRGPGKRQITEEKALKAAIVKVLKQHKVDGLLCCKYEKETERKVKYIGRGRGSADRPKKIIEKIRYQMVSVDRNNDRIKSAKARQGWKVFVTDVSSKRLSFEEAVKCYRKEYRVERIFSRLKSRMNIDPLFVQRDDQVKGKTCFLTLGARVLTLIEYVVRRSLQKDKTKLKGMHLENPKKLTATPTSEKILSAFSDINLTFVKLPSAVIRVLTPLTKLQQEILKRVSLNCAIYTDLEINKTPASLSEW